MLKEEIEKYLSALTGSEGSYPFGPEAIVFKVMGKMFALVSQKEEIARVTLKAVPHYGEALIEQHASVVPGYYMNKKHWITISLDGELSIEKIKELSENSYDLVIDKLSKKDKDNLKAKS